MKIHLTCKKTPTYLHVLHPNVQQKENDKMKPRWGVAQVVECLLSNTEVLSSILGITPPLH
jgi:hypothetical protein